MTSTQLFATMPAALALEILEFVYANEKQLYRTVLNSVAQARKVRPVFLERQSRADRFASMTASLGKPALVLAANSLVSTWLVKKHSPMLIAFLDTLGIKHENGVVESLPESVDDAAVKGAVDKLASEFPVQAVAIYLHAFNSMNEVKWTNLDALVSEDERLLL